MELLSIISENWAFVLIIGGAIAFHARTRLRLDMLEEKVKTLFNLINKDK